MESRAELIKRYEQTPRHQKYDIQGYRYIKENNKLTEIPPSPPRESYIAACYQKERERIKTPKPIPYKNLQEQLDGLSRDKLRRAARTSK